MNQKIKDVVEDLDDQYPRLHYVDTADSGSAFAGHTFCTDTPFVEWIDLVDMDRTYHPNKLGAIAYAIELTKEL